VGALRLCIERVLPQWASTGTKPRGLKARGTASGMITPGEAATIAAELAMPDLDLIKQMEQGVRDRRGRFARGRSGNPASPADAPVGTNRAGPNWFYNP
jgi:hypothetical protein